MIFSQRFVCIARLSLVLTSLTFLFPSAGYSYSVWSPESGKFVNAQSTGAADDAAEKQYHYALGFYEAKNYDKAVEELKTLTKKYPAAAVASDAQFKLGEIYEEQNEFYKAFESYKKILENYPQSQHMNEVIEREFRIGNVFLSGKRPKIVGLAILPALPRAIEVFEHVVRNAPFSEYGDKALFNLGVAFKRSGNYIKAIESFQQLIDNYPESALIPDAKFQLGEVSFEMSKNVNRSQEGLDSAEDYFDSFLSEFPQANVKAKAEQLKKAIDEKNAEKNFKIAQYYENENYLDSAMIYYEDVIRNYGSTTWAEKAKEKIMIFRSPVTYIKEKETDLQGELGRMQSQTKELEDKLKSVPKKDRDAVEKELKQAEKKEKQVKSQLKSFSRTKVSDLKKRRGALKRKEMELREKEKNLENKKKQMKNNKSEDLDRAFANWAKSLADERAALEREKADLAKISDDLGVKQGIRAPLLREPTVQDLHKINVDEIAALMEEKKVWEIKKDELYEFRKTVLDKLNELQGADIEILSQKKEFQEALDKSGGSLKADKERLDAERAQVEVLRKKAGEKRNELEKIQGGKISRIWDGSKGAVKKSWDVMTFTGDDPLAEAEKRRMKVEREIATKQNLIDTIRKDFDAKSAAIVPLETKPADEPSRVPEDVLLKKKIKLFEREIRWRYEEIQDRNQKKREKIKELDATLQQVQQKRSGFEKVGKAATAPAAGTVKFFKAFLFGLKTKEEAIHEEAKRTERVAPDLSEEKSKVAQLREDIESENLLIQARAKEIESLKKDLEDLKKQGSRYEGFSYRSMFFERPGNVLQGVVNNAKRVIPAKDPKTSLIEKMDSETRELKELEAEKKELDAVIEKLQKYASSGPVQPAEEPQSEETESGREAAVRRELSSAESELREAEKAYRASRDKVNAALKNFYRDNFSKKIDERFGITSKDVEDKKKLFQKERNKTEEELLKIVKKEFRIVNKQQELLTEKKDKIEKKIARYKKKKDYRYEVLESELQDILNQSRRIESEKKSLLEERKKLTGDFLKAEVGALEK